MRSRWPGGSLPALLALLCLIALVLPAAGCAGRSRSVKTWKGARVMITSGKIETATSVSFEFDSDRLRPDSFELLDEVARTIRKSPQVKRVRIEGHTDEKGSREYNLQLSRRRADAVKRYLVDQGVKAERLETAGFGRDRPLADNSTEIGRAQNRRVEFILVK